MQSSPPLWPWRDDTNALSLYVHMLEESHVIAKRRQEKQKNIKSTIFLEKVERVFILLQNNESNFGVSKALISQSIQMCPLLFGHMCIIQISFFTNGSNPWTVTDLLAPVSKMGGTTLLIYIYSYILKNSVGIGSNVPLML